MDCEVGCDMDKNCVSFDFDYINMRCTMLRSVDTSIPISMPTVSSGVKEFGKTDENRPTEIPERPLNQSAPNRPVPTTQDGREVIPLVPDRGTFVVPVLINGVISLNFTVDSGASTVCIPSDVVSTLIRGNTLNIKRDFTGKTNYTLADGTVVPSQNFTIRSLKVGSNSIENVSGIIVPAKGSLLLGQSFLSRFKGWSVDNQRGVLILEIARAP